jgi:transcriptional regulator with XRE-family HTH domain
MEPTQRGIPEDAAVAGSERAEPIGAYLRRQRALREITLEQLSEATRIPLRSLQRLESGAFDREPDGFARGFVRTVAIALGLPPDETVARMLPEATDDGRAIHRGRQLLARLAIAAAVAAAVALVSIAWSGVKLLPERSDEMLHRRDAVRALAVEHGLVPIQPIPPVAAAPSPAATEFGPPAPEGR